MKLAETVTFGGSALDRAAELRGNPEELALALEDSGTRVVAFWRGKPLLRTGRPAALMRLRTDHPVLAQAARPFFLLGREDGAAVFAADVSAWEPEDDDLSALGQFLDPTEQVHPDVEGPHGFVELRRAMTWIGPRDAELAATGRALFEWHRTHRFCSTCGEISDVGQAGWQRDCPICGRHHFPRTDPVVIMLVTRGNSVLLGRSPGWPEGMYSLLAGFVEPGETIEAAVRREVFEETGIRIGAVGYLASQPWPFPASLMVGCAAEALSDEITVDPNEIEDAIWVSREDYARVIAGEDGPILPARKGAIAHFLLTNWLADRLD